MSAGGHPVANRLTLYCQRAAGMTSSASVPIAFGLMIVAMMLPASIGSIRATAARSLWRRRQRAVAEHVLGFAAVWLALVAASAGAIWLLGGGSPPSFGRGASALVLSVAALWQLTPVKRRSLRAHHRTRPLAPSGFRADRDCLVYGAESGWRCVLSCGPMMVAMLLVMPGLATMAVLMIVMMVERYRYRPPRRSSAAVIGALAAAALGI